MIADRLIEDVRAAGYSIEIEGGDLVIEADSDPPAELVASLRRHKAEVIALLSPCQLEPRPEVFVQGAPLVDSGPLPAIVGCPGGAFLADGADWRDLYEERCAIREFDGGHSRAEAECLAWSEMENRWHIEHGERVPPDICAGCRRPIGSAAALDLIDGCRVHLTDDNACLIRHGERWRAMAAQGLIVLGLRQPTADVSEKPVMSNAGNENTRNRQRTEHEQ